MARVVLEQLTKVFQGPGGEPIRVVDNLSLAVEDKELLVLVGPSGCGKTTTLRLIAGLEEPTGGSVSLDGQIVNTLAPKDRDVAMVFQNGALYPHMSVYENLAFGLKLRQYSRAEIETRVKQAAGMLGLAACLERKPGALSGGERQRVALGRALVRQPRVFLFDEPLSSLDANLRAQMRAEMSRLHRQLAATTIYVTHDQVEALALGDRIAVMKSGVIQQVARPLEVYRNPANVFVAGFFGSPPMNFLCGTVVPEGNALFFQAQIGSGIAAPNSLSLRLADAPARRLDEYLGKQVILGIRPEDIAPRTIREAPPDQTIEAQVQLVQPMGSESHVHLMCGAGSLVARLPASAAVRVNERLAFVLEMRQAHFFDPATQSVIL